VLYSGIKNAVLPCFTTKRPFYESFTPRQRRPRFLRQAHNSPMHSCALLLYFAFMTVSVSALCTKPTRQLTDRLFADIQTACIYTQA